ncbi:Methionine-R-sulfoxide reductase B1-A [Amphibalanus amphitrite]|uniref:Methionine-R-sulfoxide reductase B1-A n=1 Tax=Amphibalanus amphitrite TaxID=1232801 RepID=A0A6A4XDZ0_AMPAM|nr:Methionine-R-sulfoxide reductase B1-A [Amphibalanus amphitrite]
MRKTEPIFRSYENVKIVCILRAAQRRALLLCAIGDEAYRVYENLPTLVKDEHEDDYDVTIRQLRNHYEPKTNVIVERFQFRQRGQQSHESTADYAAVLHGLAKKCNFGAMEDELIRDQIVEKTPHNALRQRLLQEHDLTLPKLLGMAEAHEQALQQAATIQHGRAKQLFKGVSYEPTSANLYGFGHNPIQVHGTLPAIISYNERNVNASFYLVDTPRLEAIMGMDVLSALGLTLHPASHTIFDLDEQTSASEEQLHLPAIDGYAHRIQLKPDAYKPGHSIPVADTLSRLPLPDTTAAETDSDDVVALVTDAAADVLTEEDIRAASAADPVMEKLRSTIRFGWPDTARKCAPDLRDYFAVRHELQCREDGIVMRGPERVVVPETLRSRYLELAHAGLYACSECSHPLFPSEAKYQHHTPWPAFTKPVSADALKRRKESSTAFKVQLHVVLCLYGCAECGHPLFRSSAKYEHHTPWPAFTEPVADDSLSKLPETEQQESSHCTALKTDLSGEARAAAVDAAMAVSPVDQQYPRPVRALAAALQAVPQTDVQELEGSRDDVSTEARDVRLCIEASVDERIAALTRVLEAPEDDPAEMAAARAALARSKAYPKLEEWRPFEEINTRETYRSVLGGGVLPNEEACVLAMYRDLLNGGEPGEAECSTSNGEDSTSNGEDSTAKAECSTSTGEDSTSNGEDSTASPECNTSTGEDTVDKEELRIELEMQEMYKRWTLMGSRQYALVKESLCSYELKTAMMWVCERRAPELWTWDGMLESMMAVLDFLLECAEQGALPCYFAPETNLWRSYTFFTFTSVLRLRVQLPRAIQLLLAGLLSSSQAPLMRHLLNLPLDAQQMLWCCWKRRVDDPYLATCYRRGRIDPQLWACGLYPAAVEGRLWSERFLDTFRWESLPARCRQPDWFAEHGWDPDSEGEEEEHREDKDEEGEEEDRKYTDSEGKEEGGKDTDGEGEKEDRKGTTAAPPVPSRTAYLTEAAANELQLQGEDEDVDLETVNGSSQVRMKKTQVQLSSVDKGYKAKLSAFVIKDLSSASTKIDWNLMKDRWDHMKKIPFPTVSRKGGIDMLIGLTGDTMSLFLPEETIQGPPGDPVAVKTPLGWTAFGPVSGAEMESIKTLRTHIRSKLKVENQEEIKAMREMTELEVIGVREQKEKILSVEDKEAMKKVEKMKHEGGRYEVNVPWRNDEPNLSGNFGYALSRLRKTEENMKKRKDEAMEKKYGEIFEDYVKKGYFLKIAAGDENWTAATCEGWFLPHFPVIRQDRATTKIRLVFDAAAKYQGRSLNDELYPGPSICSDLIEILLGFRRHPIALTGDVEEMFLQVKLATADKKYHRVLWRDGEAERAPDIYEAQRWIFGNAAAPFAAQYVMKENALIHAAEFPLAAQAVERSFYMDDALCSFKTEEEAKEAREQLTDVMKQAGMHIRKWRSSSSDVTASIPEKERAKEPEFKIEDGPNQTSKTLGLLWNADEDTLGICATTSSDAAPENRPTKRLCLKKIAAVFDPLCLICPLTITAKIIFQETWARGLDWDDPLPPDMEAEWLTWLEDIQEVSSLTVPRCVHSFSSENAQQLHVFSDASEQAYAAVIYVVTDCEEGIVSRIALARARVTPRSRKVTIPRLELMAALLGLRLVKKVCAAFEIQLTDVVFWSDSLNVICWIKNDVKRFQPFVAHRVSEIRELTSPDQWRHIPGTENPADLPSRGVKLEDLKHISLWWEGPPFLLESPENWPKQRDISEQACDPSEFRKEKVTTHSARAKEMDRLPATASTLLEVDEAHQSDSMGAPLREKAETKKNRG